MNISEAHRINCMEFMREFPDKFFDLAIPDPEYGRKQHGGTNRSKYVKQKNGSKIFVEGNKYDNQGWDDKPADNAYFDELIRVSKNQIIWGCNYYNRNFGPGRIVWDKVNYGSDQSDCEIAYNSMTNRVDLFRFMWRGMMQGRSIIDGQIVQGNKKLNEERIHPTQKPVLLYKWILKTFAKKGFRIFDSHMGSQSSRIAAYDMGFDYWGCELNISYFHDGCNRFEKHKSQLNLFK